MTDHDTGTAHLDLLALLRGELSTDDVVRVRDHVAGCPECRDELLELAVGHSLLTASVRSLAAPEAVALPEDPVAPAPAPHRRRRVVAGIAAAAVVLAGAGVAALLVDREPTETPAPPVEQVAETRLEGVDGAPGRGQVTMSGSDVAAMTVETTGLPRPRGGHYYYVWLLDPETNKMLPVGQVEAEGSTTFRLPLSLLRRYSAIDVSLEADNGDPSHSVTSVLRADYRTPSGSAGS
jgi:hypothetical protein